MARDQVPPRHGSGLVVCHSSVWEGERGRLAPRRPPLVAACTRACRNADVRTRWRTVNPQRGRLGGVALTTRQRRHLSPRPPPVLHRPGWGDWAGSGLPVPVPPSPHLAAAFACPPLSAASPACQPARPPARLLGRGTPVARVPAPYCRAQPYGRAQRAGVSRGWRRSVWTRLCLLCRALFWLSRPGRRSKAAVSICFRPLLAPPAAPR